jgi:hypothetical protein
MIPDKKIREISGGLAYCMGKLSHLGISVARINPLYLMTIKVEFWNTCSYLTAILTINLCKCCKSIKNLLTNSFKSYKYFVFF